MAGQGHDPHAQLTQVEKSLHTPVATFPAPTQILTQSAMSGFLFGAVIYGNVSINFHK